MNFISFISIKYISNKIWLPILKIAKKIDIFSLKFNLPHKKHKHAFALKDATHKKLARNKFP